MRLMLRSDLQHVLDARLLGFSWSFSTLSWYCSLIGFSWNFQHALGYALVFPLELPAFLMLPPSASCAMLLALDLPTRSWCYALYKLPHVLNATLLTFSIELPELSPGTFRRSRGLGLVRS